ncbi:O-methyltransferase [Phorcysia thermohydrogeniphila]|uniref:Putative O-methyltransferase YrrM n=1 Tax=Phorcysia thermohydrogeniphila TaxID=936138 RepID=A0A4R1GGY1_9BACT|nr:O-methyltransferase [Phorcysia thermohydrogeniphila]TCK06231.1 putative O-methyltransferase YrrM [Phorcysia thermohydrogeniphila]
MFKRWQNLGEILPDYLEKFVEDFGKKEEVLLEIEEFAKENKVPILLPSAASFLRFLVSLLRPKRVLEIGTGIGYSTLNIYYAYPEAEIITVDSNKKRALIAKEFFKKAGAKVELLEKDAFDVIRDFLSQGKTFDLIFIDSVKAEYPFFNYKVQALLSDGGVAVFDNVLFRGYVAGREFDKRYRRTVELLKLFLSQVKEYPAVKNYLFPVGDGLLVVLK